MGGAFISLQMSRWIAKRATGVHLIDGRSGNAQLDWLYQTIERLTRQANLPMPEVGVYESGEVNAFATGPSKSRSLVAVSAGLLPHGAQQASRHRDEAAALAGTGRECVHFAGFVHADFRHRQVCLTGQAFNGLVQPIELSIATAAVDEVNASGALGDPTRHLQ